MNPGSLLFSTLYIYKFIYMYSYIYIYIHMRQNCSGTFKADAIPMPNKNVYEI